MKCQVKKLLCRFSYFHLFLFSHPKYNINFFTKSSHPQARKKKNGSSYKWNLKISPRPAYYFPSITLIKFFQSLTLNWKCVSFRTFLIKDVKYIYNCHIYSCLILIDKAPLVRQDIAQYDVGIQQDHLYIS